MNAIYPKEQPRPWDAREYKQVYIVEITGETSYFPPETIVGGSEYEFPGVHLIKSGWGTAFSY